MKKNNHFKDLEKIHEIPPELKKRVMTSVRKTQLLLDIVDLFTDKISNTLKDLFFSKDKK